MTAAYIREYYNVPAELGRRITVDGQAAEIIGFDGAHLLIRLADAADLADVLKAHPTWRVDYTPDVTAARSLAARTDTRGGA